MNKRSMYNSIIPYTCLPIYKCNTISNPRNSHSLGRKLGHMKSLELEWRRLHAHTCTHTHTQHTHATHNTCDTHIYTHTHTHTYTHTHTHRGYVLTCKQTHFSPLLSEYDRPSCFGTCLPPADISAGTK